MKSKTNQATARLPMEDCPKNQWVPYLGGAGGMLVGHGRQSIHEGFDALCAWGGGVCC